MIPRLKDHVKWNKINAISTIWKMKKKNESDNIDIMILRIKTFTLPETKTTIIIFHVLKDGKVWEGTPSCTFIYSDLMYHALFQ